MRRNELKAFFVGSLLGDGHVGEKNKNTGKAGYIESHSRKQKDYLVWKERLLTKNLNCETYIKDYKAVVKGKEYETCSLVSKHSKYFGKMRDLWYKDRIKILPKDFVKRHFNALSLAIWFLDDGHISYIKGSTTPHIFEIATYNFSLDEVQFLCELIEEKFGAFCAPRPIRQGKYFRVRMYGKDRINNLIEIISPYVPDSMKYKIDSSLRLKLLIPEIATTL